MLAMAAIAHQVKRMQAGRWGATVQFDHVASQQRREQAGGGGGVGGGSGSAFVRAKKRKPMPYPGKNLPRELLWSVFSAELLPQNALNWKIVSKRSRHSDASC